MKSPDALETYRSLLRTTQRLRRAVRALLSEYDLTGAQYATLTRIPPEGIPLTELAKMAWAAPSNSSGVVDRLEREGWVRRRRSSDDRRVVLVELTPEGKELLERIHPRYVQRVEELMAPLGESERAALVELLAKLEQALPPEE